MPSRTKAALAGLVLSAYAVYVEHKMEVKDPDEEFVALCDIDSIGASCSNVFRLPEGRMLSYFGVVHEGSPLDVPNALLGMVHYLFLLTLSSKLPPALTSIQITMAFASTVFLAYQLTFVLFELCLLCWSTHVINTFIFVQHFFLLSGNASTSTTSKKNV